jgi:hypothetical protein
MITKVELPIADYPVHTGQPIPVYVENRSYGLLYPLEKARKHYGVVKFGSDGPWELHRLDTMKPVSWDEFDDWLYDRKSKTPKRRKVKP